MIPVSIGLCAHCGNDASMRCAGCLGAPEYETGDAINAVYCGRDCQKEHWSNHKMDCKTMRKRRALLRVATMLKTALLTYREVNFDLNLTKIELEDGILNLYQSPAVGLKRQLFPSHLTTNTEHREAALAHNQCTTAMALLGRLTRKLLAGVPSTVEIMDIHIGKPLVPTRLIQKLIHSPYSGSCPHTVLKVKPLFLPSCEEWVLDTAGCQYGFRDVLIPLKKYLADKECRIGDAPTTYDATETKDLDYFSTLPFMNSTRIRREKLKLERRSRLHFALFVDAHGDKDMVDGSEAEFRAKLDRFESELKSHMLDHFNQK